jgi:hypothetical protein
MDQEVPFHASARENRGVNEPAGFWYQPTAVQAVAEVHETLDRTLSSAPGWSGVGWMDQEVPFQISARVLGAVVLLP